MTSCFAYGSNLDQRQMERRCPDAASQGKALLQGYRLAFTRFSNGRGGGVADIIHTANSVVWGVVFDLNDKDLAALDKAEGYNPVTDSGAYLRRGITVWMDGLEANAREVQTYWVAKPSSAHVPPTSEYLHQIVTGARAWGLPDGYVSELMKVTIAKPAQT